VNIPQECNNPINLMLSKPVGECTEIRHKNEETGLGYCYFPTPSAGWRAAHRQIKTDQNRLKTIRQFLEVFAPKTENDTENYIKYFCDQMNCKDTDYLEDFSKYAIAGVLAQMEGYYNKEA
jgi:hypothetical protein